MAIHENDSVVELVRSVLADIRELIRDELDLARAEVREEIVGARAAGLAFAGAAFAAVLGVTMFSIALGSAIAYWLGWPVWTGYAMVSLLLFVGAYVVMTYGRKRLSDVRALPRTRETLKENLSWIQNKSAQK